MLKKFFSFMLFFIMIIIISCSKKSEVIGTYETVDSIKVNSDDILNIYNLKRINKDFIFYNLEDHFTIFLIDNTGKILSKYSKKGKGPGEILRIQRFSVYNNKVFVIDADNMKLLIFNLINKQIKFEKEFKIKNLSMIPLLIDDKILISNLGTNNLRLYSKNGKLLKTFSIDSKKNIKNMNDFIATGLSIEKFPDSNIITFAGFTTGKITFCEFENYNDSLNIIANIPIKHRVNGKIEIKEGKNKDDKNVNVNGLRSHQCINKRCIISIKNPKIKHSFEVYDEKANYLGLIKLNNMNEKDDVYNSIFSNDEMLLWFTKNDNNVIYIAKKVSKGGC